MLHVIAGALRLRQDRPELVERFLAAGGDVGTSLPGTVLVVAVVVVVVAAVVVVVVVVAVVVVVVLVYSSGGHRSSSSSSSCSSSSSNPPAGPPSLSPWGLLPLLLLFSFILTLLCFILVYIVTFPILPTNLKFDT